MTEPAAAKQYIPRFFDRPWPMDFERDRIDGLVSLTDAADWSEAFLDRSLRAATVAIGREAAWLVWQERPAEGYGGLEITDATRFSSLCEVLERGLTDEMRAALALSRSRLDALAQLDALCHLVERAEWATVQERGRACLSALADAFALDPMRTPGDGALGRPVIRDQSVLAYIARLSLAWFLLQPAEALGRVHQMLALVGQASGQPAIEGASRAPTRFDRFFAPSISLDELADVQRGLAQEFGAPEPDSLGYYNGRLADDGMTSEKVFGPKRWLRCRCGQTAGLTARATRCAQCGVLCDDARHRETNFAALHARCGLVHPAAVPAIAQLLERTESEVWALARGEVCLVDGALTDSARDGYEYGPVVIREALAHVAPDRAAELLITAVPVLPVGDRPELVFLADTGPGTSGTSGTSGTLTELAHPVTAAYASLLGQLCSYDRLVALQAPALLMHEKSKDAQLRFDALLSAVATPIDTNALDGWGLLDPERDAHNVPLAWRGASPALDGEPTPEPGGPPSCLWLNEHLIAVQRAGVTSIFDLERRAVVRRVEVGWPRLQACDDTGRFVVVTSDSCVFSDSDDGPVLDGFGCFAVDTGAWLEALPPGIPAVTFGKWEPEDGALYELRRGQSIAVGKGDRPTALCYAHGNRFVLESGDYEELLGACIRATQTGLIELSGDALDRGEHDCPTLGKDGALIEQSPTDDDDEADASAEDDEVWDEMYELWRNRHHIAHPAAIVQHAADTWRLLLPDLLVCTPERDLFTLGFAIECACFRPDGERLLAVTPDELLAIDIESIDIVWRAPLTILDPQ